MTAQGGKADDARRRLPSIDQVLQLPAVRALEARYGRSLVTSEVRRLVAEARARVAAGDVAGVDADPVGMAERLAGRLESVLAPSLVRVINATGVVIHTNLGRAPLPAAVSLRVAEIASGY